MSPTAFYSFRVRLINVINIPLRGFSKTLKLQTTSNFNQNPFSLLILLYKDSDPSHNTFPENVIFHIDDLGKLQVIRNKCLFRDGEAFMIPLTSSFYIFTYSCDHGRKCHFSQVGFDSGVLISIFFFTILALLNT